ncbi:hypothetical protein QUS34_22935, partial [Xanthomonas citri pv. citri]
MQSVHSNEQTFDRQERVLRQRDDALGGGHSYEINKTGKPRRLPLQRIAGTGPLCKTTVTICAGFSAAPSLTTNFSARNSASVDDTGGTSAARWKQSLQGKP